MRVTALSLCILFLASSAFAGAPHHPVGYVKRVSGKVTVVRAGVDKPVKIGDPIFERDRFRTGKGAGLGFALMDGTRLTTGENSTFSIDKYKFDTDVDNFSFVANLWEGTYEFISGMMSDLAPGAMRVITPTGAIEPEGTRFVVRVEPQRPSGNRRTRRS